jgi:hypothetical protein
MLDRLRRIADGKIESTQHDLNFYTHEMRESERYSNLGWECGQPSHPDAAYELWNNAHTATLEDYGLKDGLLSDAPKMNEALRRAMLELILVADTNVRWTRYNLDRSLAVKGFAGQGNLASFASRLAAEGLIEERPGDVAGMTIYAITDTGRNYLSAGTR